MSLPTGGAGARGRATLDRMGADAISAAIEDLDDDFNVFSARATPPDEATLAGLEAELGAPLPAAHRRLLASWGCLAIIAKDEVWPPPIAFEIRPAWQMHRGLELYGVAPAGHPLSILTARAALHSHGAPPGVVPLMKQIGAFAYVCADGDELVWLTRDGREPVADYQAEALRLIAQLVRDKDRIKLDGVQRS